MGLPHCVRATTLTTSPVLNRIWVVHTPVCHNRGLRLKYLDALKHPNLFDFFYSKYPRLIDNKISTILLWSKVPLNTFWESLIGMDVIFWACSHPVIAKLWIACSLMVVPVLIEIRKDLWIHTWAAAIILNLRVPIKSSSGAKKLVVLKLPGLI